MSDNNHEKNRNDRAASLEKYLEMKEHEKDAEIRKGVIRLQQRIHDLLYSHETDQGPAGRRGKND